MEAIQLERSLSLAWDKRPEMLRARADVESSRLEYLLARKELVPSLSLDGSVVHKLDIARTEIVPGVTFTTPNPTWRITANLVVPIWQGGSLWQGMRKAQAQYGEARAQMEDVKRQVTEEVSQSYIQIAKNRKV